MSPDEIERPGRRASQRGIAAVVVAAVVATFLAWRWSGPEDDSRGVSTADDTNKRRESPGALIPGRVASSPESGSRHRSAESIPADLADCSFFERWRIQGCSASSIEDLVRSFPTFESVALECVPSAWLVLTLILDCEGRVELGADRRRFVAAAVTDRLPEIAELRSCSREAVPSAETLPCLLQSLSSSSRVDPDDGRIWAWGLRVVFLEDCDLFSADPAVVEALMELMADWPLHDDSWWEGLWEGIQEDPSVESAGLRVAIYEALFQVLPKGQWLGRLQHLSALEQSSGVGGLSLYGMGETLARRVPAGEYFELVSGSGVASDEWSRAVVLGFPPAATWPEAGHASVPDATREALQAMRDSEDYGHKGELLGRQWGLLGPDAAVADLERFVFLSDPHSAGWDYYAGMRIGAAIEAALTEGAAESDHAALEHAANLVRDFLLTGAPQDTARVLTAIRDRGILSSDLNKSRRWRARLVSVLGPDGVASLGSEFQEWLTAP
jgi:hypothetical protein